MFDIMDIAGEALLFPFLSVRDLCSVRTVAKAEAQTTGAYMDKNEQKMHKEFELVLDERDEIADEFYRITTATQFTRFEEKHPNGPRCLNPRKDHLSLMERFYRRVNPTWTDEEMRFKLFELHVGMWEELHEHAVRRLILEECNPGFAAYEEDVQGRIHGHVEHVRWHNVGVPRCPRCKDVPLERFLVLKFFFDLQKCKRKREREQQRDQNEAGPFLLE
jgi:hypothetical protein